MTSRSLNPSLRARGVTAILGPTNTGKTWYAIERMLTHPSGIIGLPLRLLAREVYQRVAERVGQEHVALITGEEKIKPDNARYWVCTVEAMPRDFQASFVAVDEIQLAADLDRGHVFTDRLLNHRGLSETLLLGSAVMRPLIETLIPGIHIQSRPRLSELSYSGAKKISRLPSRSAIVAFSIEEVYEVAELIRRQKGGAAVVLGALSPRTRNAQVELFQSGEVDYIVATDAIGMGLNLDVRHVAFASDRKFDGFRFRNLYPYELAQIAGRAGRHLDNGTFGTTGRCPFMHEEVIEAIEKNQFDPFLVVQWRNTDLDFSTLDALRNSLDQVSQERGLTRAPLSEDVSALEILAKDEDVRSMLTSQSVVERLWETCQIPDYRKVSPQAHADLIRTIFQFIVKPRGIPNNWFKRQISALERTDGDIDALFSRISQVRTWSFIANRPDWLRDSVHWQIVTRQVEDTLSDALHERLTQRFIDRRTNILLRRLRENKMLEAEISITGDLIVEGQHIGTLSGFVFTPDAQASAEEIRTLRQAAQVSLTNEIQSRADRFAETADSTLVLSLDGLIRWMGEPVASLEAGEKIFEPRFRIIADEILAGASLEKVTTRLQAWLKAYIHRHLEPLFLLEEPSGTDGIVRGLAFQIFEGLGVLERAKVLNDVRGLSQDERASLRQLGIRFGGYHLFMPALLKPAPRLLIAQLWALSHGGLEQKGLSEIALLANSGRTSFPSDPDIAAGLYKAAGFRLMGKRALRVDILERLADLIRPAIAYKPGETPGAAPDGTADGDAFIPTVSMTSLVGCAGDDFAAILEALGYESETRKGPAITVSLLEAAPIVAVTVQSMNQTETANLSENDQADGGEKQEESDKSEVKSAEEQEKPSDSLNNVLSAGLDGFTPSLSSASEEDFKPTEKEDAVSSEIEAASEVSEDLPAEETDPEMIVVWRYKKRPHFSRDKKRSGFTRNEGGNRTLNRKPEGTGHFSAEKRKDGPAIAANAQNAGQKQDFQKEGRSFQKNKGKKGKPFQKRKDYMDYPQNGQTARKAAGPDPDSPFAKLMALKEQFKDGGE